MQIIYGEETYTRIKNLDFAPETDVFGTSLPINEFTVDIITTDSFALGADVQLVDDMGTLWAQYSITYAEQQDAQTVRIRARSRVAKLEQKKLPAVMYESAGVPAVVQSIIGSSAAYTLDAAFSEATVTGFCPEQSARERLVWVCFVIGAYVKSFFSQGLEILPLEESETLVPMDKTYWRPSVTYKDHVTAVQVTAYSFAAGTPASTDKWVQTGDGTTYIVTEQRYTLSNPEAPAGADENVVTVDGVMLVNAQNVDEVLSHQSKHYFKRTSVELDAVNNAEYMPGQRLTAHADEEMLVTGYAMSAAFTFGLQAKSRIVLEGCETKDGARLIIKYLYNKVQIGKRTYTLPVGYVYSIQNPYIDWTMSGHRYIFRPQNEAATEIGRAHV